MGKRIISRRRGSGTPTYRSPSHRHHGPIYHPSASLVGDGTVISIEMAPGRSAPVAEVTGPDGSTVRMLASAGLATGDRVAFHEGKVDRGAILPLSRIPDGTLVSNIEVKPFDGAAWCEPPAAAPSSPPTPRARSRSSSLRETSSAS